MCVRFARPDTCNCLDELLQLECLSSGVFAIVAGSHAAAVRRERVIKRHGVLKTVHNPHLHVYASTLGLSEDSSTDTSPVLCVL